MVPRFNRWLPATFTPGHQEFYLTNRFTVLQIRFHTWMALPTWR
jgi:hypothetical protein